MRYLRRATTLCLAVYLLTGCKEDSTSPRPPADSVEPSLNASVELNTSVDSVASGLAVITASWSDSSGVDWRSATVRSLQGINGSADANSNLIKYWAVQSLGEHGVVLRETLDNL